MKTFPRALLGLIAACSFGTIPAPLLAAPARIVVDQQGVMRWKADRQEVRLFGANYCAFASGDYRLAKRVGADMKKLIDADMGHFARMGWDGLRLCSWGDWESSDGEGNLTEDVHTGLMDYLIFKAGERGISMLLSPIVTYGSSYADQIGNPDYKPAGFSSLYERAALGTNPKAIAAQTNYIGQVLNHVNPYTRTALKDDPAILFVEMINEPVHHPENLKQSVDYINALVDAVRGTGSEQITFHNYSQDFAIREALVKSNVQGIDFGWYPSGLVSGHTLKGNFLPAVDSYPALLDPALLHKARIVYEFDQADLNTGYLYPAMARTFRSVGAQFAAVFAYDMLDTAPYNLSWQTHFINLVHTPRKAVSAVIAGEAMRRLPRMASYGAYPASTKFGDFSVDYETDSSLLNAADAFMHAGDTAVAPRNAAGLERVVGFGSSPVVSYEGTGAYFLDKIRDGVWRLEVYPDALLVGDPFAQPQPGKVVSRLYFRPWQMGIALPDLGPGFSATPLTVPANAAASARRAQSGSVEVEPGVWLLSRSGPVDFATLPATVNRVGLREFHVNAQQTYPDLVQNLSPGEFVTGAPATIRVRLASQSKPERLNLYIRDAGTRDFGKPIALRHVRGYDYAAPVEAARLPEGQYEFIVVQGEGAQATAFPDQASGQPGRWPFEAREVWRFTVTGADKALELFNPRRDKAALTFARLSESDGASGFKLVPGENSNALALSLALPQLKAPQVAQQYAGSVFVGERIAARGAAAATASTLSVRLKAAGGKRKTLDVLLIEKDGSSWRASMRAGAQWSTRHIGLDALTFARSALTPTPYPGTWNYWRRGPAARGRGKIRPDNIERVELRVYRNAGEHAGDDARAVEIASVQLHYGKRRQ
ncbi:hypothetical protein [Massilia sp. TSP1-1-2]|uniref:hypothetical protein n=1 Tax=Massilia sp. TSP1-1-2 TaxID=2804649 RepID=UPI003CF7D563